MRLFAQDTKVEALKRIPLFEGLSRKELVELARVTEDVEVPEGKVLCREGEIGQEFFVIIEGEAEVTRRGKHLATDSKGDFFGEISLLENSPRVATVRAKTPLRFFVLTGQDFRSLLDRNPSVERKVLHALARRVLELSNDPALA
ncbi:MAG TPA: cyclic nucleotide-binding domain-containing protein [Thermoleophilaceae bacterium]|nr:cyclic nucleotide-binding domain-containing protein [Thermoleophilaceae bacterium]